MAQLKKNDGSIRQYALTAGSAEKLQNELGCKMFALMEGDGSGFVQSILLNPMNAVKAVKFCFQLSDEELENYEMDAIYEFVEDLVVDFFPKSLRAAVKKMIGLLKEGMSNPDLIEQSTEKSQGTP